MPVYRCEIINAEGRLNLALKSAASLEELGAEIQKTGAILCKATPEEELSRSSRIGPDELTVVTRKLHAYLKAHLPLGQALFLLTQEAKGEMGFALETIKQQVMEGTPLHKAMSLFPEIFSPLYVNSVKIGEESGMLPSFLKGNIDHLTAVKKIKEDIISALTYPLILVAVAVLTVLFLATTTIPVFESAIRDLGGAMPPFTMAVIGVVQFIKRYFFILLIVALPAYLLFTAELGRNRRLTYLCDRVLFFVPVLSPLFVSYHRAVFSRTMHLMMSRGLNLMETLAITIETMENLYLKECLEKGFRAMGEGGGLRVLFRQVPPFDGIIKELSLAGEETGALPEMFSLIFEYESEEMKSSIKRLLGLMEPLLILLTGFLVGGMLIAMFLPIFQLGEGIR